LGAQVDLLTGIWDAPINISDNEIESRAPALAADGAGGVHIVWEEGRHLYHSYRQNQSWSAPRRVATGEQPAIAIDLNNVVHLVFVNEFRGNYEIYYCQWAGSSWTLPRNVSSTSGVSANPDIAIDSHNTVYVTWTDNSPGYAIIYYGVWNGTFWINRPIPNGRGKVSAIAIGGDDLTHIVWQDRDSIEDEYDIYHVQGNGNVWTLPENISDSAGQSTIADLAVDDGGMAHLVWEEQVNGTNQVYYSYGYSLYWSVQEDISQSTSNCYLARLVVDQNGFPHVSWDEFDQLTYVWRPDLLDWVRSERIAKNSDGIADVSLYARDGGIHAAWRERLPDGNWDVFYSAHSPFVPGRAYLPWILRQ
jgi:hypothetical protein